MKENGMVIGIRPTWSRLRQHNSYAQIFLAWKTPDSYLGILLAVEVDGSSEVMLSYEPKYLGLGFVRMILGFYGLQFLK